MTWSVHLYFTQKFRKFAAKSILKWKNIIEDWVILGDVIVVHYEDIFSDKIKQMERILEFLQFQTDTRRLNCLRFSTVDIFKRKSNSLPGNPFSGSLSADIKKHIEQVDTLLLESGHPGIPYNKYKLF